MSILLLLTQIAITLKIIHPMGLPYAEVYINIKPSITAAVGTSSCFIPAGINPALIGSNLNIK